MSDLFARMIDPAAWDWGSVPDYIVALTAIVSAVLVIRQLSGLGDDRRQAEATRTLQLDQFRSEAQTARANLLLRIDEQFESIGVFRSRARWIELRAGYRRQHAALPMSTVSREDFVRDAMISKLNELWDQMQRSVGGDDNLANEVRDYNLVMRLPNWIESIGMIGREGLIPVADILQLYRSVILTTIIPVEAHVRYRRSDPQASQTVLANALWLADQASRP